MKESIVMILAVAVVLVPVALSGVWTDDFERKTLANEWEFRDRREKVTKTEVKDGFLRMTNPKGNWGHMTADKAMLERDVPASSQKSYCQWYFLLRTGKTGSCLGRNVYFRRRTDGFRLFTIRWRSQSTTENLDRQYGSRSMARQGTF